MHATAGDLTKLTCSHLAETEREDASKQGGDDADRGPQEAQGDVQEPQRRSHREDQAAHHPHWLRRSVHLLRGSQRPGIPRSGDQDVAGGPREGAEHDPEVPGHARRPLPAGPDPAHVQRGGTEQGAAQGRQGPAVWPGGARSLGHQLRRRTQSPCSSGCC
jgi:hypothetical protein